MLISKNKLIFKNEKYSFIIYIDKDGVDYSIDYCYDTDLIDLIKMIKTYIKTLMN